MQYQQQVTQAVLKLQAAEKLEDCPLKRALLLEAKLSLRAAKNDRLWEISQQFRANLRRDPAMARLIHAFQLSKM